MSLTPDDFAEETDDVLVSYMAMQHDDADAARAAWHALYVRHHGYLIGILLRTFGGDLGGRQGAADLAIDAFRAFFEWAGKQDDPDHAGARFRHDDPGRTRRAVRGYMTRIAKNLFTDQFRGPRAEQAKHEVNIDDEAWERAWSRVTSPLPPEMLSLHERAFELLTEREAEILRLSLLWYDPDAARFQFPPGEAEKLADALETTPENLRQLRSRALRRLRNALAQEQAEVGGQR